MRASDGRLPCRDYFLLFPADVGRVGCRPPSRARPFFLFVHMSLVHLSGCASNRIFVVPSPVVCAADRRRARPFFLFVRVSLAHLSGYAPAAFSSCRRRVSGPLIAVARGHSFYITRISVVHPPGYASACMLVVPSPGVWATDRRLQHRRHSFLCPQIRCVSAEPFSCPRIRSRYRRDVHPSAPLSCFPGAPHKPSRSRCNKPSPQTLSAFPPRPQLYIHFPQT